MQHAESEEMQHQLFLCGTGSGTGVYRCLHLLASCHDKGRLHTSALLQHVHQLLQARQPQRTLKLQQQRSW
jgi:hypothetical protein